MVAFAAGVLGVLLGQFCYDGWGGSDILSELVVWHLLREFCGYSWGSFGLIWFCFGLLGGFAVWACWVALLGLHRLRLHPSTSSSS